MLTIFWLFILSLFIFPSFDSNQLVQPPKTNILNNYNNFEYKAFLFRKKIHSAHTLTSISYSFRPQETPPQYI